MTLARINRLFRKMDIERPTPNEKQPSNIFFFNAVKPEENYLSQKFGKEYLDYSAKVKRWI